MYNTELNNKQHECLDRIALKDPLAKVVGWNESKEGYGPIVKFPSGNYKFINVTGYARRM